MLSRYLLHLRPQFSTAHLRKLEHLLKDRRYSQILQIDKIPNPTYSQVKNNYYRLIKKYHSDNCPNDEEKSKLYEEITKIIIKSYHEVDKDKFSQVRHQQMETKEEDQICMELFGKKYSEVKYWMYEEGNERHKNAFFQRLFQKTGRTNTNANAGYADFTQGPNLRVDPQRTRMQSIGQRDSKSSLGLGLTGAAALIGLFLFASYINRSPQPKAETGPKRKQYTSADIQSTLQKKHEKALKKAQQAMAYFQKDHPPCLYIPHDEQPHLLKQLTEYSIAPDIHLFEVEPKYYQGALKQQVIKNGLEREKLAYLNKIKPNTTLTLSLEAERALQNVYVKVKDVMKEIKEKGKYTPPQVLFRFHGYILVQIREKPMTLTNYRDTDYISLFDLYFDYYSPLFLKKDYYAQYLVGKDEPQFFGWVHFNRRKCTPVYLKADQKAAFFVPVTPTDGSYEQTWTKFYSNYSNKWE